MSAQSPLKRIRLDLARSKDHPEGSTRCGYELIAPIDKSGHIDVDAWKGLRSECRVRRFWLGQEDETGLLVHKPGGSEHARWMFDYDQDRDDDDETGYRFGAHVFAPGEYVTVRSDNVDHTFRVTSVERA